MARDKKKIKDMTRDEMIPKIINQINSLNKKIKAFKKEDIDMHEDYVKGLITNDMVNYNDTGSISKSKLFFKGQNDVWLKKTLASLQKVNNNEIFGTVKKYKKEVDNKLELTQMKIIEHLRESDKGYTEQWIQELISDKGYIAMLYTAFANNEEGYGSLQVVEKVALQYKEEGSGMSDKEVNKIISNIEYSRNSQIERDERQKAFERFLEGERNGGIR